MASHGGSVIISRSSAPDTFYCDMNTRTTMDADGEVEDKPIANSLKELINNMNVNPNIREKEENKCFL